MKKVAAALGAALICGCGSHGQAPQATQTPSEPHIAAENTTLAGRYAVQLAGCNDCHTSGWSASGGTIPTSDWLTGSNIGFRGPWGVVYPINVRLFAPTISRSSWIQLFQSGPPVPMMPFWDYDHGRIAASDLGAMYDFIVSLGKAGTPAPRNVPPGQKPKTKVIDYVPH